MAKKILAWRPEDVQSGQLETGEDASDYPKGTIVGLTSTGTVKLADFRASAGPLLAVGVLLEDTERKDPKGNVLETITQLGFASKAKVGGFTGLTPGRAYFLVSGGSIQLTPPAGSTGDLDQVVGYAINATTLMFETLGVVRKA